MKVNKKALYALAAYYDAVNLGEVASIPDRRYLADLVVPCIKDSFNEAELYRSFLHGEVFFRSINCDGVYVNMFNDKNIAKLLRYVARNGKFPRNCSLRYV